MCRSSSDARSLLKCSAAGDHGADSDEEVRFKEWMADRARELDEQIPDAHGGYMPWLNSHMQAWHDAEGGSMNSFRRQVACFLTTRGNDLDNITLVWIINQSIINQSISSLVQPRG